MNEGSGHSLAFALDNASLTTRLKTKRARRASPVEHRRGPLLPSLLPSLQGEPNLTAFVGRRFSTSVRHKPRLQATRTINCGKSMDICSHNPLQAETGTPPQWGQYVFTNYRIDVEVGNRPLGHTTPTPPGGFFIAHSFAIIKCGWQC